MNTVLPLWCDPTSCTGVQAQEDREDAEVADVLGAYTGEDVAIMAVTARIRQDAITAHGE